MQLHSNVDVGVMNGPRTLHGGKKYKSYNDNPIVTMPELNSLQTHSVRPILLIKSLRIYSE